MPRCWQKAEALRSGIRSSIKATLSHRASFSALAHRRRCHKGSPNLNLLKAHQAALLELWQLRRAGRRLPARADFDVIELRPWLGDLHLLDVENGGADFRYRIFATNISQYLGREMTGKLMSQTPEPRLRALGLSSYREVIRAGVPYLIRRPTLVHGPLSYQTIRDYLVLPLGADDTVIDRLLVLNDPRARARASSDFVEFLPLDGETAPYTMSIDALVAGAVAFAA